MTRLHGTELDRLQTEEKWIVSMELSQRKAVDRREMSRLPGTELETDCKQKRNESLAENVLFFSRFVVNDRPDITAPVDWA